MRVLVVDDSKAVRKAICTLLSTDPTLTVCGEACDGRDAIAKAQASRPNIVLMDITMPNMDGLEATREIKRMLPEVEVLIVSQHESPEVMRQAMRAGAKGYVSKSRVGTDLLTAIEKVSHNEIVEVIEANKTDDPKINDEEILHAASDLRNLRIKKLTEQIQAEQDPQKFTALVEQLGRLLEAKAEAGTGEDENNKKHHDAFSGSTPS